MEIRHAAITDRSRPGAGGGTLSGPGRAGAATAGAGSTQWPRRTDGADGPALHDRDRQPGGERRRCRRARARRQRRRRDGGGTAGAEPGRAAIVGHRRRGVPALLGCQGEAAHHASTGARRRRRRPGRICSSSPTAHRWRFDEAVAGGRSVGRAGHAGAARAGAPAAWAAALGGAGRAGGRLAEQGLRDLAAPGRRHRRQCRQDPDCSRRRGPISSAPTARRDRPARCCATPTSRPACA